MLVFPQLRPLRLQRPAASPDGRRRRYAHPCRQAVDEQPDHPLHARQRPTGRPAHRHPEHHLRSGRYSAPATGRTRPAPACSTSPGDAAPPPATACSTAASSASKAGPPPAPPAPDAPSASSSVAGSSSRRQTFAPPGLGAGLGAEPGDIVAIARRRPAAAPSGPRQTPGSSAPPRPEVAPRSTRPAEGGGWSRSDRARRPDG